MLKAATLALRVPSPEIPCSSRGGSNFVAYSRWHLSLKLHNRPRFTSSTVQSVGLSSAVGSSPELRPYSRCYSFNHAYIWSLRRKEHLECKTMGDVLGIMPESGVLCQREPAHLVDQNEPLDKFLLNQRFHQSFMEFADSCLAGESVHFYEEVQQPDKRNIEFKVVSEIGMIDNILKIQNDVKHEVVELSSFFPPWWECNQPCCGNVI
ncbi:uncharacterized protein [Henckelia pumila]|uniref:uncharacterized protein isoform X2 n=3 Tax=Henckelia pumila TaxID=405737 RepID=UPI003C6E201A